MPSDGAWSALGSPVAVSILRKLLEAKSVPLQLLTAPSGPEFLQMGATPRYFISAVPEELNRSGLVEIRFPSADKRKVAECVLSSSLFYWFWCTTGSGFNLTRSTILRFPIASTLIDDCGGLHQTTEVLREARKKCMTSKLNSGKVVYNVNYNLVPEAMATLDRMLASHYGFTAEELDFLINYDIKYRMGREAGEEE
jgi:hypothetical protein